MVAPRYDPGAIDDDSLIHVCLVAIPFVLLVSLFRQLFFVRWDIAQHKLTIGQYFTKLR